MSENKPPAYRWIVTLPTGQFSVDAAYPVIDDGHLLLKDSDHKIVFAAAPGTGCTVTRGGPAVPPAVVRFPDGCTCSYSWEFTTGDPAGGLIRHVSPRCRADHTEVDQRTTLAADKAAIMAGAVSPAHVRSGLHGFGDSGGPPA